MTNTAAFFDIDKTILSENTGTLYLKYLHKKGLTSRRKVLISWYWFIKYRLNLVDMENLSKRILMEYRGQNEKETAEISRKWFEEMGKHYIYPEIVPIIENHRRQNHILATITAGTKYTAEPISNHLGIKHVIGTIPKVENSHFSGEFVEPICFGKGKLYWAKKFAEEHNVDLKKSYFYTDSITDMPLLLEVGNPVIVNPDIFLKREAIKRGWKIMEFGQG
jgi:HAD superfamily hydrolase (TIGR01490 family)